MKKCSYKGNYVRELALFSHISAGVPGTVNGLIKIFNDYGSGNFTLAEIIQPAINLAEKGFPLEENAAHGFDTNKKYFIKDSGSHAIFVKNTNNEVDFLKTQFKNNSINQQEYEKKLSEIDEWATGDIFIQKDLAKTLKRISKKVLKDFMAEKQQNLL